jgi:hypothetical protein
MADDAEFSAPSREKTMRPLTTIVAAIALVSFVGVTAAPAAPHDIYKVKKAECKKRADTMHFGIHLIKKSHWVKNCIAGKIA